MAKLKLKLSKSLIARLGAIAVLLGLGTFAVYQSQFPGSSSELEEEGDGELALQTDDSDDTDSSGGSEGRGEPEGAQGPALPPVRQPGGGLLNPSGLPTQSPSSSPPNGGTFNGSDPLSTRRHNTSGDGLGTLNSMSDQSPVPTRQPGVNPDDLSGRNGLPPAQPPGGANSIDSRPPLRMSDLAGGSNVDDTQSRLSDPSTPQSGTLGAPPSTLRLSDQSSTPSGQTGTDGTVNGGTPGAGGNGLAGRPNELRLPGGAPPAGSGSPLSLSGSPGGQSPSGGRDDNPSLSLGGGSPDGNAVGSGDGSYQPGGNVNLRLGDGLSSPQRGGDPSNDPGGPPAGGSSNLLVNANRDPTSGSSPQGGVDSTSSPPGGSRPGTYPWQITGDSESDDGSSTSPTLGSGGTTTPGNGYDGLNPGALPPGGLTTGGNPQIQRGGSGGEVPNYSSLTGRDSPTGYDQRGGSYGSTSTGSAPAIVSDVPGNQNLEGPQSPAIEIEKKAPREIQVGQTATFEIVVRNIGQVEAVNVVVTDRVPAGTRLESSEPRPITGGTGLLVWELGAIKPGREQIITMNLVPERRGEIGSVAQVTFNAQAGVRTLCTQPVLDLEVEVPERVLIGQNATVRITVTNNGDGAASNVVVEEDVPLGVSHPEGRELQYVIGTLAPGESRQLALTLRAEDARLVRNIVSVRGDNNLFDEEIADLEVVAPQLNIAMEGPRIRYLERQAVHTIEIRNQGTAPATNVDIVARLPRGLQFVETNNRGAYDAATHSVYWGLQELPFGVSDDSIQLITLPVETGEQTIEYTATADLNLVDSSRLPLLVEELAELFFNIDDVADPIEVGSETLYHLRVTNQGSKDATGIMLRVDFPAAISPLAAEGPVDHELRGQSIWFNTVDRLPPGGELLFKIQAQGRSQGDHRVDVVMISAESESPVVKQASTKVYIDR